ncbi:hypothetical protein FOXYSP1_17052 [Fusarium oxysporum f. sp. phaseoli]
MRTDRRAHFPTHFIMTRAPLDLATLDPSADSQYKMHSALSLPRLNWTL